MSSKPTSLKLDSMLCFDVYAANHAFGRLYKPLLEGLGLTYSQYLVMVTLWSGAPQSVGEIGTQLGLESNTLTPLLKRLEAADLVTRTRDAQDERRMMIRLTEKGAELEAEAEHVPGCVASAAGLTREEYQMLQKTLRQLGRRVTAAVPPRG